MAINLADKVIEFLQQNPEQKFTARQIASWIVETYPDECRRKQERSRATANPLDSEAALLQQIRAEISSGRPSIQKRCPQVKTTEDRPMEYYFTRLADDAGIGYAGDRGGFPGFGESRGASAQVPSAQSRARQSPISGASKAHVSVTNEHDLYPVLSDFLWSELKVYSKRIDEKRSRNRRGAGGNEWLYPDLVGMENLSRDWHREIKDCVQQYDDKKTTLWSFEVKIRIERANVRKVFFQTVSNSSWANFGYLAASDIKGPETRKELRMLTSLHGIGVIRLDADDPSKSEIMIPARGRSAVDWDAANRLAEENKDFLDYIKLIRQFYQTGGDIRPADWDMSARKN